MAIALNLLIVGKSGVGKSSFINYVTKKDIAKVGAGKNITTELIKRFDYIYKGSRIDIYDTKAIKLEETVEKDILIAFEEKKKRADFDFIIYCISSSQTRINMKEIEKIIELRKKNKKIIFVITSDDIKKEENKNVINKIKERGFKDSDFIRISSEEKDYLEGTRGKKYGEFELFEAIKLNLKEHITKNIMDEFAIVIERRVPMWSLRCQGELKNNKSLFVRKSEKRTEEELIKDFNVYLNEAEEALNDELISILKSIYRKYNFMYKEEVLDYCEQININSKLYLPDKFKKIYNFTVIDRIEKNLIRHWSESMKEVINKFGV